MSIYRNVVWFYKGMSEYTRSGYLAASKNFKDSDLNVDCSGKVYVITGANSGIGKCIATEVVQRGGTVHMLCRNEQAAAGVADQLKQLSDNKNVFVHIVNLAEPGSICQFAKDFAQAHDRVDVLVNNAGCMTPKQNSSDGFEVNFATNSLSPYILTRLMRPLLINSKEPRVIFVSSGGMLVQKLDSEDPQCLKMNPFDPTMAYAQHKRQQVVLCEMLAEEDKQVFYASMHPGWADTPAVRSAMPDFYAKMKDRLRTAEQGADCAVWLAVSPAALTNKSGLFYQDRTPVATHLPLAWTKTSPAENTAFMNLMNDLFNKLNNV